MNRQDAISRRDAISRLAAGAAGIVTACSIGDATVPPPVSDGHLTARPGVAGMLPSSGLHRLFVAETRDAILYIPPGLSPTEPLPLVVALHGDPGSAELAIGWFRGLADEMGFLLMAPASRDHTWDAVIDVYDWDVPVIDRALETTFATCRVDPARIGLVGFSDGGTYSIALGLSNGDLFRRLVSFSPGFLDDVPRVGKPPIYVTHGTNDLVLPIDVASRRIVPELRNAGYDVTYREFTGGHVIPAAFAREALAWVIGGELVSPGYWPQNGRTQTSHGPNVAGPKVPGP